MFQFSRRIKQSALQSYILGTLTSFLLHSIVNLPIQLYFPFQDLVQHHLKLDFSLDFYVVFLNQFFITHITIFHLYWMLIVLPLKVFLMYIGQNPQVYLIMYGLQTAYCCDSVVFGFFFFLLLLSLRNSA